MDELVKSLRIGIVNIVGVMVPGFFFVVVFFYALVLPAAVCWGEYLPDHTAFADAWSKFRVEGAIGLLVTSYVVGYIIRLLDLDWADNWSRRVRPGRLKRPVDGTRDRYPYASLEEYLNEQGFGELSPYVIWSHVKPGRNHINALKMAILRQDEKLAAVLGALEAHIRLVYGMLIVGAVGAVFCLGGATMCFYADPRLPWMEGMGWTRIGLAVVLSAVAVVSLGVFHKTRAAEAVRVVVCAYLAFEGDPKARKMVMALKASAAESDGGVDVRDASGKPSSVR